MKKIIYSLFLLGALSISGCQKEGPKGDQGETGPSGPDATTFNFTLTFPAGSTYQSYSGISGFDSGDVLLVYSLYDVIASENYYNQLPAMIGGMNIIPEFSGNSGHLFINTYSGNTQNSPWITSGSLAFKAVLIKSSGIKAHPEVNLSDYQSVKKAFNLTD